MHPKSSYPHFDKRLPWAPRVVGTEPKRYGMGDARRVVVESLLIAFGVGVTRVQTSAGDQIAGGDWLSSAALILIYGMLRAFHQYLVDTRRWG